MRRSEFVTSHGSYAVDADISGSRTWQRFPHHIVGRNFKGKLAFIKYNPALLAILLSLTISSRSQINDPPNRGTYCMAAIIKNGVVAMSDSRVVHFESDEHSPVYAYFDGFQKIFIYDKIFFQALGQYTFSNYTLWGLFQRFTFENKIPTNPKNFFDVFSAFVESILTKRDYEIFSKNDFLVSGFDGTKPAIYFYNEGKLSDSALNRGYLSGDLRHNGNIFLYHFFDTASLQSSLDMFKKLVDGYAQPTSLVPIPKIGGPISYGFITATGRLQRRFQDKYNFTTKKEEIMAALKDQLPLVYRSRNDSITYKKALRDFLDSSK